MEFICSLDTVDFVYTLIRSDWICGGHYTTAKCGVLVSGLFMDYSGVCPADHRLFSQPLLFEGLQNVYVQ